MTTDLGMTACATSAAGVREGPGCISVLFVSTISAPAAWRPSGICREEADVGAEEADVGAEEADVGADAGEEEEDSTAIPTRRDGAQLSAGADTNCGVSPLIQVHHACAIGAPRTLPTTRR